MIIRMRAYLVLMGMEYGPYIGGQPELTWGYSRQYTVIMNYAHTRIEVLG